MPKKPNRSCNKEGELLWQPITKSIIHFAITAYKMAKRKKALYSPFGTTVREAKEQGLLKVPLQVVAGEFHWPFYVDRDYEREA
jgi:hypothetical protein